MRYNLIFLWNYCSILVKHTNLKLYLFLDTEQSEEYIVFMFFSFLCIHFSGKSREGVLEQKDFSVNLL